MTPNRTVRGGAACPPRSARRWPIVALATLSLLTSACLKVPPYQKPSIAVPPAFKEQPPEGWKQAQPGDGAIRGKWWEVFNDPALNTLEEQVGISNQNVLQAEAQYRAARAAVRVARSALFPTLTSTPAITETKTSSRAGTARFAPAAPVSNFDFPFEVSYQPDVWDSLRRGVAASAATAQSSDAQLENVRLLYQTELALDYFQLHGLDGDSELLDQTVKSYQEYLQLTKNRFEGGVASDSDVAQAETQLYTTQSQLTDVGVARTQMEHAIATLIGKTPAELTIPPTSIKGSPPPVPVAVPSALLERRPDIADAERQVAAANQQIGIAKAAFYPTLTLAATGGAQAGNFVNWITWPSRFWTVGPQLAELLFDAGKRRATVQSTEAQYDATAAAYRQSVLTAFQQVEDNLSALRILDAEAVTLGQAVKSAERAVLVSTEQYKAGTVNYLQVITTQTIALQDEKSAVDLLTRQMTASVQLIQALGGGWDTSRLPTARDVGSER
ncbi:MAG TPA: efflux transporter outer membrane subunit [Bryobacteraceae bacterium]|nr:efflux transporter outer membrane subunit [Bryobacteraceae bacterium]